jgi:hypothetical protein
LTIPASRCAKDFFPISRHVSFSVLWAGPFDRPLTGIAAAGRGGEQPIRRRRSNGSRRARMPAALPLACRCADVSAAKRAEAVIETRGRVTSVEKSLHARERWMAPLGVLDGHLNHPIRGVSWTSLARPSSETASSWVPRGRI